MGESVLGAGPDADHFDLAGCRVLQAMIALAAHPEEAWSRALKLPTFLREYEKLAAEAAREGLDHVRFLLRAPLRDLQPTPRA
jgi:hypothetical protein